MQKQFRFTLASLAAVAMTAAPAIAQDANGAAEMTLDQRVSHAFEVATTPFVNLIFSNFPGTNFPWIVGWLVIAATIFTVYFGVIQFRAFPHAIALVKGDYSDPNDAGEVSHFQALATALSGTVGLGNIAGVAVAVSIGGPGATFWMILAGLLGMASKFTECTLGVKYRNEYADGTVSGGPMYYMTKGFAERGFAGGKFLAIMFAIFCILGSLGGGNMFQSNQAHAQIAGTFGDYPGWITGVIFAVIVFAVIIGGLKSIAQVTEKIVPFMGVIYVGTALIIILMNYDRIGWAFGQIFEGAFTGLGVAGGMVGALIQGFRRAAFSNEAGVGSAAIAHSAVRTKEPITEGFVSLLEPFIDTVVICTMTALVIIITGQLAVDPDTGNHVLYTLSSVKDLAGTLPDLTAEQLAAINAAETGDAMNTALEAIPAGATADALNAFNGMVGQIISEGDARGVGLTSAAFSSAFGWFRYVLVVAVVLFAFSTMISWSYYGVKAWTYLFGEGKTQEVIYKVIFCIFVFIGAAASLDPVIAFSDAAIFAMAIVNIIALYFLMPVVKRELHSYLSRLKSGEIKKFH